MKKILLSGLFLLAACQSALPEPTPTPEVTATRISPTPVPATLTPTIIPSPSLTPTPLPPERYFIEEFDSAPLYWSTLYAAGESSRVDILDESGKLTFELYSPAAWIYAIYGAFEYESVHIETQVESHGSEVNSMGLVCHYHEQDGWYEFNVSNDGTYNLLYGQWLDEGIARYAPILIDTSKRIELGNSTNQIGLDCYENIVQLYINEKLIRKMDVSRYELAGGKVGLSLASFEDLPVILSFDWVEVSEP
jgi:hypothetical protein